MGALAAPHSTAAALSRAQCIVQHTLYVPGHLVHDEPMTRGVTLAANCLAQAGGAARSSIPLPKPSKTSVYGYLDIPKVAVLPYLRRAAATPLKQRADAEHQSNITNMQGSKHHRILPYKYFTDPLKLV